MTALTAVGLSALVESPLNHRKIFNKKKLDEMAQSIRRTKDGGHPYGILEPLLVRPGSKKHAGKYEIIAGHRRFRAAHLAKVTEAPITVCEADDKTVLEMMAIENEQREDVHPLEQAEGYSALLKHGYTVEELAARIGKEVGYVYRRLQLLQLDAKLKQEFLEGKFPYSLAVLLARLQPADQLAARKEALYTKEWEFDEKSGKEKIKDKATSKERLNSWIQREVYLDLKKAGWKLDDPSVYPEAGACTNCPKRTGANLALFEDLKGASDRCLDRACFHQKERNLIKIAVGQAATAGKNMLLVALGYASSAERSELPKGTLYDLREVDTRCQYAEDAVVVHTGHTHTKVGSKILICRSPACKIHRAATHDDSRWRGPQRNELKRRADTQGRFDLIKQIVQQPKLSLAAREKLWILEALDPGEAVLKLLGIEPAKTSPSTGVVGQLADIVRNGHPSVPGGQLPELLDRALVAAALESHGGSFHPYFVKRNGEPLIARVAQAFKIDAKAALKKNATAALAALKRKTKKKPAAKKAAKKGAGK